MIMRARTHNPRLQKVSDYTPASVQKELLGESSENSPVSNAFEEWVRNLHGIKTFADIKRDNHLEYAKLVFLCEHNLLFNLQLHRRFDLLHQLFNEDAPIEPEEYEQLPDVTQVKLYTDTTEKQQWIEKLSEAQIAAVLNAMEVQIKSECARFNLWINLHQARKEIEYIYYIQCRNIRLQTADALDEIISESLGDKNLPTEIREALEIFLMEEQQHRASILSETKNLCLNTDGSKNTEQSKESLKIVNAYTDAKLARFQKATEKYHRLIPELSNKIERARAKDFQQIENAKAERHEKLELLDKQIAQLASPKHLSQTLEQLQKTVHMIQQKHGDKLSQNSKLAFHTFLGQIGKLKEQMQAATEPDQVKNILSESADKLGTLLNTVQDQSVLSESLKVFQNIHRQLVHTSQLKPSNKNSWPEHATPEGITTNPPVEESPKIVNSQTMKSMLQEVKEAGVTEVQDKETYLNLPEQTTEECLDILSEISENLNKSVGELDVSTAQALLTTLQKTLEQDTVSPSNLEALKKEVSQLAGAYGALALISAKEALEELSELIESAPGHTPGMA